MDGKAAASLCRIQNCLRLVESLNLSPAVGFKVYRQQDQSQRFLVVISVAGDAAFPVYNTIASNSDLALFRGMLLTVTLRTPLMSGPSTDAPPKPAEATSNTQSNVLQAFLPKFDITRASVEDAAASEATVAASIRKHADQHVMLVSVKHSGHLATISDTLVSSKSSVASVHCAAAVILLHAHFARVSARRGEAVQPEERLKCLQEALRQERCSVSFEVVTRCMEHHGQVPAGEYLVATAMTRTVADGTLQVVPWTRMLAFCTQHSLPVNDCWVFSSQDAAAAASHTLARLSLSAPTTHAALSEMQQLCEKCSEHSIRITGTYPHEEWQGARIEGFVVAQGQATSDTVLGSFRTLSEDSGRARNMLQRGCASGSGGSDALEVAMRAAGLMDEATGVNIAITNACGSRAEALERQAHSLRQLMDAAPHVHASFWDMLGGWSLAAEDVSSQVLDAVRSAQVPLSGQIFSSAGTPSDATSATPAATDARVASRSALASLSHLKDEDLDGIAGTLPCPSALLFGPMIGPSHPHRHFITSSHTTFPTLPVYCLSHQPHFQHVMRTLTTTEYFIRITKQESTSAISFFWASWHPSSASLPQLHAAGGDASVKSALIEYMRGPTSNACTPSTRKENPENRAMHALSKPLQLDNALRYKVKMWMFRRAPKPVGEEPSADSRSEAHVGYCMMTMIIRNGLQHLLHGRHAFAEHALLVTRHHCLQQNDAAQVVEFAQAWYDWVHMHASELIEQLRAGDQHLASASYLAHAEKFAAAFTAAGDGSEQHALTQCVQRPMRGVLVLVGFESDAVEAIAGRVGAQVKKAGGLVWSPAMPALGPLLAFTPIMGHGAPKDCKRFWAEAAADTMVVVRPLPPFKVAEAGGGLSVAQKRVQGLNSSAQGDVVRCVQDYCRQSGVPEERRILRLDTPQWLPDDVLDASQAAHSSHGANTGLESDEQRTGAQANSATGRDARTGEAADGAAVGQKRPLEDSSGEPTAWEAGDSENAPPEKKSKKDMKRARKREAKAAKRGTANKTPAQQPRQIPALAEWVGAAAAESLVDQVVRWVGAHPHWNAILSHFCMCMRTPCYKLAGQGVEPVPFDPAIVLVFVSIPGVGKTFLCEKLMQSLDHGLFEVVHCHGDAMATSARNFWSAVAKAAATRRADGRTTLVLADKNLIDSPTGNLQSAAATLRGTGAVVLPVLFTAGTAVQAAAGAGALQSSLPGELLAMAMHRVLSRASHAGKLDSSAPEAMHAVNAFANTLKKIPRCELGAKLQETFGQAPCMVPVWSAPPPLELRTQLQPLLSTVAEGDAFKGFPCKPTEESQDWERRLRELLCMPENCSILQNSQAPVDEQVSLLTAHVLRHLPNSAATPDVCMEDMHEENQGSKRNVAAAGKGGLAGGKRPVYIALAGFDAQPLLDMFTSAVGGADASTMGLKQSLLDGMIAEVKRDDLHVTLWHKNGAPRAANSGNTTSATQSATPPSDSKECNSHADVDAPAAWHACGDALIGMEGKEVGFTVTGFDLSERCAAARVDVEGDDVWACMPGVAERQKGRMHVTLWTAKGVEAKKARDLRGMADRGDDGVVHVTTDAVLRMKGAVELFF